MYLDNSHVRLITVKEDGSVEILFKDKTFMDIPKERVFVESQQRIVLYTCKTGKKLFHEGDTFWGREKESDVYNMAFTVSKEDTKIDGDDIYIKNTSSVKFV